MRTRVGVSAFAALLAAGCATGGTYRMDARALDALHRRILADDGGYPVQRRLCSVTVRMARERRVWTPPSAPLAPGDRFAGEIVEGDRIWTFRGVSSELGGMVPVLLEETLYDVVARRAVESRPTTWGVADLLSVARARGALGRLGDVVLTARTLTDGRIVNLRPGALWSAHPIDGELEVRSRADNTPLTAGLIVGSVATTLATLGGLLALFGSPHCSGFVCITTREFGHGLLLTSAPYALGGIILGSIGLVWHPDRAGGPATVEKTARGVTLSFTF